MERMYKKGNNKKAEINKLEKGKRTNLYFRILFYSFFFTKSLFNLIMKREKEGQRQRQRDRINRW